MGCPNPCGCLLAKPKVIVSKFQVTEFPSDANWDTIQTTLNAWGVKSEMRSDYEKGAFFDSANFQTFSFMVQNGNGEPQYAAYEVAIGTIRNHDSKIIVGYLYANAETYK